MQKIIFIAFIPKNKNPWAFFFFLVLLNASELRFKTKTTMLPSRHLTTMAAHRNPQASINPDTKREEKRSEHLKASGQQTIGMSATQGPTGNHYKETKLLEKLLPHPPPDSKKK